MGKKHKRFGTRERILRSAARLYALKGPDGTSVDEIMADAGMTKPVLYYHFENKDALSRQVFEYVRLRIDALEDRALSPEKPPDKKLAALFTCYFRLSRLGSHPLQAFKRMLLSPRNAEMRRDAASVQRAHLEKLAAAFAGPGIAPEKLHDLAHMTSAVINYFVTAGEFELLAASDKNLPARMALMVSASLSKNPGSN
jgi:AcrR family transcriptional regulator